MVVRILEVATIRFASERSKEDKSATRGGLVRQNRFATQDYGSLPFADPIRGCDTKVCGDVSQSGEPARATPAECGSSALYDSLSIILQGTLTRYFLPWANHAVIFAKLNDKSDHFTRN